MSFDRLQEQPSLKDTAQIEIGDYGVVLLAAQLGERLMAIGCGLCGAVEQSLHNLPHSCSLAIIVFSDKDEIVHWAHSILIRDSRPAPRRDLPSRWLRLRRRRGAP